MESNYNSNLDTVLLVKLTGCAHCVEYDKSWPDIRKHLEIRGSVNTDSITKIRGAGIPNFYKDVDKHILVNGVFSYPCIVWISKKSLNEAKAKNGGPLDVVAFNIEKDANGKLSYKNPSLNMSVINLLVWIDTINKSRGIDNKNNSSSTLYKQDAETKNPSPSAPTVELQNYCTGNRRSKKHSYL